MTREELRDYVDEQRELDNISYHVYSALIDGIDTLEQEPCDKCVYSTKDGYCQYDDITETLPPLDPCETCGYAEGSPFCLQYCPHDAEREKEQEPTKRELGRDYLLQSFVEALKVLQAENDDLKEKLKLEPCTDAVSREAVIERLKKEEKILYTPNGLNYLIRVIEKLPSVTQKSGKWIPVSERLPEDEQEVLITYKINVKHHVWSAIWDELHCRFYDKKYRNYISVDSIEAWMPLPKPYEPQESGDKE